MQGLSIKLSKKFRRSTTICVLYFWIKEHRGMIYENVYFSFAQFFRSKLFTFMQESNRFVKELLIVVCRFLHGIKPDGRLR